MLKTFTKGDLTLLACEAMATRFEFALHGDDPARLRAAGEEAIREVYRVERQLSFRMLTSELNELNRMAGVRPVKMDPEIFSFLSQARSLSEETHGSFDPTVGPLMACWGLGVQRGAAPDDSAVDAALRLVGIGKLEFDESAHSVFLPETGMKLDCGSIGKGYALDIVAGILDDIGIRNAFLQGGTSTILAQGVAVDGGPWRVGIAAPVVVGNEATVDDVISTVDLEDESLSVSGISGRTIEWNGRTYGHVLDPRSGHPVKGALLAAMILPSATETDALSTALLVDGEAGVERMREIRKGVRGLISVPDEKEPGYRIVQL